MVNSRLKLLLLAVPLLAGWFAVIYRRNNSKPLPSSFAVCSARNRTQVLTMDEQDSRVGCIVVEGGLIAATGSLKMVRRDWGDVDTTGNLYNGKGGGIKIIFLRKGEMLLPGL